MSTEKEPVRRSTPDKAGQKKEENGQGWRVQPECADVDDCCPYCGYWPYHGWTRDSECPACGSV